MYKGTALTYTCLEDIITELLEMNARRSFCFSIVYKEAQLSQRDRSSAAQYADS